MAYRCAECGAYLDTPWEAHECTPPPKPKRRRRVHDSTPRHQADAERERLRHEQEYKEWDWRSSNGTEDRKQRGLSADG